MHMELVDLVVWCSDALVATWSSRLAMPKIFEKWPICKTPLGGASQPHNGAAARQTKGGAVILDVPGGPGAAPTTPSARRPKALGFCFGLHDFRISEAESA